MESTSVSGAPDNSSLSHFSAMTRPSWLGRAARNRHRHAIEQASRRWRGGRRGDSARTRREILISTQVGATARLYELELARDDAFGFFERTTHRKVPLLEGYPEEYSDDESVRREARKRKKEKKKEF